MPKKSREMKIVYKTLFKFEKYSEFKKTKKKSF